MAVIRAIGTAVPPHIYTQTEVIELVQQIFASVSNLERYLSVYKNTGIQKRHFSVPKEWFKQDHSFAERNQLYIETALELGTQAALSCLQQSNCSAKEIDHIIFVSSTGISTPSIDAHLCNRLQLNHHVKRTPIWGLGCAGGAVGLSRAFEYVKAFPNENVLLITVELCGLTFLRNDQSKSNIVATSLFGDGAAAVLITGEASAHDHHIVGPKILGNMSTLFPDSIDVMGWELKEEGLKVIFSRDIPTIISEVAYNNITQFLSRHGISLDKITHYILHPGGKKVLDAYEEALGIVPNKTKIPRQIIEEYGNMSSSTVLFVLERFLKLGQPGELGIIGALGPGFSSELLLVQW